MSRIGKKPVPVPAGVKISIEGRQVCVEGPLGKLEYAHRPEVEVNFDEHAKEVVVTRHADARASRAYPGLTRSLVNNMMEGVTKGYEKRLEIVGVGYRGLQGSANQPCRPW